MSRKTTTTKSSSLNPEQLYNHWLYEGKSLRKIGAIYGVSRTTVQQVIRSGFGKHATNPRMNSFARVVAQEYGDKELLQASFNKPGKYLTRKKEQNLTTFQAIEFLDNFPVEPEEVQEGLGLPLFIEFTRRLCNILFGIALDITDNDELNKLPD